MVIVAVAVDVMHYVTWRERKARRTHGLAREA